MPFTLSHAAAALPFRRTRLLFSAVVFGSFAPDYEYFLRFGPRGRFGHSPLGIAIFDMPVSFIMLWLFHRYAKEPLWLWLPGSVRKRVNLGPRTLPLKGIGQVALVIVSLFIGILTHMLWDSFTHPYYWPYRHWPLLSDTIQVPLLGSMPYYLFFQFASTILGALILLVWCWHWYCNAIPVPQPQVPSLPARPYTSLAVIIIVAILAGLTRAWLLSDYSKAHSRRFLFVGDAALTTMSVFCIGVVVYGFLLHIRDKNSEPI